MTKLEKEKSFFNSIFDVFDSGVAYVSFLSSSGEVFSLGEETVLEEESIYKYSHPVTTIDGKIAGTLLVGFYRSYYDAQARRLFYIILNKILFIYLLSILVVFLVSKRFTKSFEESEKRFKDDFLVSVSHEFKSPLAAIEGYSDLMMEKAKKSGSQDMLEGLNAIKDSTGRLKYFINNVLSLAEFRAGKVKAKGTSAYIDEVVEQESRNFKSVASLERKKFIIDILDGLPPVLGDAGLLGLAVSGTLNNAFKFTKEGDAISVKAMLSQDYGDKFVEVWISDTGIGIPKELLKKIFEKFYQIKRNKFEKLKGSGLGLSLTSEIISLYKGTIWAESKVGEGTTIKFILPVFI
ncbi:MAG: HAMP domain-containing histidine kinase [Endomicrobium sp.]|nr:HAMP domain-containing histidine kinase [Endomicrobium sp.]